MVTFVLLVDLMLTKEELKSVLVECGVLSAVDYGIQLMLVWSVVN